MISTDYLIVGAGFAGAATAYQLTRRGLKDIFILEQEAIPGFHSSGRNAAMVRQCVPDPLLLVLARDGAAFLQHLPKDWPVAVWFKQNGSLLLGSGEGWEKLKRDAEHGRSLGIETELWTTETAKQRVPTLKGAEFEGAVWCRSDGIVDIHALLSGFLKFAAGEGTQLRYHSSVREIRVTDEGFQIYTEQESFSARILINAAGAWSNSIARMAGARELPLRPCRRHLFVTQPLEWVDRNWPFVWDVTHEIYFRPEGSGLLLCACDQEELAPGDPPIDSSIQEILAEKIQDHIPALSSVSIHKSWAGLRTLSSDGRFVIGWDPVVDGLFWVAGLGGHGVTTSAAVGALAADLLLGEANEMSVAFSPGRFT